MFSSAELIEALRRRTRRSLRPELPPGEFPPGWQAWFVSMRERIGLVTGASSEAIVAIFLQRELAIPPRRVAELNRWQAFTTVWRQQWHPAGREDRRMRVTAYVVTLVVHLLLAVILLWLASVRFPGVPAPQGEEVVQVEFIGEGTPQEEGGGAASGKVPDPATAAPSATARTAPPAQAQPAPQQASQPQPSSASSTPTPAVPQPPSPPAAQPLQVTQAPQPDSDFTLPPSTPRVVVLPQPEVTVPELRESARAIEVVEIPVPTPAPVKQIQPQLPTAHVTAPQLQASAQALPAPQTTLHDVTARQVTTAQTQVQVPSLQATIASLPSPASTSNNAEAANQSNTASASTAPTATMGNVPGATAPQSGGPPAPGNGTQANASSAGAGPKPAAKPGAWSTSQLNDDWGVSDRNRPGAQAGKPGQFDTDGRPRPPGSRAAPRSGLPPGTVEENIADLDRAGTWLKRKPIDYTPTRFDRFWAPSETLLQEWVRRNIREVSIPIPGTSKKLRCVVSLLQLGGGCGIDDPNMQDQEAGARPPPDIPFKPELQQDQGE